MFYQRIPNGPFTSQMHWGHMASTDLVTWQNQHHALYPEPNDREAQLGAVAGAGLTGQGSKGIWSGDVVSVDGTAYAFFTSVNYGGLSDPGVTRASSDDPDLVTWTKDPAGLLRRTASASVRRPTARRSPRATFHVFVDDSVVDVFINDAAAFSNRIYPTSTDSDGAALSTGILLYSGGGETLRSVDVWPLRATGS